MTKDPLTLDRPLPTKIGIVGFADSRDEAPFGDPSWELWGVNDVYFHVPRIDRSFELHEGDLSGRRNPNYQQWLKEGKTPVYVWNPNEEFPSTIAFPKDIVMARFGNYFTNSISWMTAMALLVLCEEDGKPRPGVELGFWGVDMAHETEYGAQRPSCEYYIGMARAMGIKTYIPATSDLLKAGSLYGIETTHPMRVKLSKRMAVLNTQHMQLMAQEQQLMAQVEQIRATRNQLKGAMGAFKYTQGVWTMPTEDTEKTDKVRSNAPVSDGQGQPQAFDMETMLRELDVQETKELQEAKKVG